MGRFRLKRKVFSHGLTRVHEMRDLATGRLLGRISLWADNREVVPELVEEFLIESKLLPEDWRDQVELRDDQAQEDGAGPVGG